MFVFDNLNPKDLHYNDLKNSPQGSNPNTVILSCELEVDVNKNKNIIKNFHNYKLL